MNRRRSVSTELNSRHTSAKKVQTGKSSKQIRDSIKILSHGSKNTIQRLPN